MAVVAALLFLIAPACAQQLIGQSEFVPPPSSDRRQYGQARSTSGLVQTQSVFDPTTACPDTPLIGSGIDLQSIDDQVALCVNAIRSNPDAFACDYPCNYTEWRTSVLVPPRGVLTSSGTAPAQQLNNAAEEHSTDMATNNYFSHISFDNRTLQDRAQQFGFQTFPLGENIAAGYNTVRDTALAWMCSEGHRTNLMGCGFDTVGTGVAINETSAYKIYYTQDFGCSRDDYDCACPSGTGTAETEPPPQPICGTAAPGSAESLAISTPVSPSPAAPATPSPTTAAPATTAVPTPAPTTVAPTTAAPTTPAPTTRQPSPPPPPVSTRAPTTAAPATLAPTTRPPSTTTRAPTTSSPTTAAATTAAPTTASPTTAAPTTSAPTTASPTTAAPTTAVPRTAAPTTAAPTTAAATTAAPTTAALTTAAPTTSAPLVQAMQVPLLPAPASTVQAPLASAPAPGAAGTAAAAGAGQQPSASPMALAAPGSPGSLAAPATVAQAPAPAASAGAVSSLVPTALLGEGVAAPPGSPPAAYNASAAAGCLYTTYMEVNSGTGTAVTNEPSAVVIASFENSTQTLSLSPSSVTASLDNGGSAAVTAVQAFPGQAGKYLIQVEHPSGYQGNVTVSIPAATGIAPLEYGVVSRSLVVQSLASFCANV